MSKWEEIEFKDVVLGDKVKITKKEEGMFVILKGKVTNRATLGDWFTVGKHETFYPSEFIAEEAAGNPAKLYRKVMPFVYPTKLGAIISTNDGSASDDELYVLVTRGTEEQSPWWYSSKWGILGKADLEDHTNHKVISEGVDVP